MLRLLFANSNIYTELVYIPAAEKSKLAGEERIVPGIIAPPTQQKTELFQTKQLFSIYYINDKSEGQS